MTITLQSGKLHATSHGYTSVAGPRLFRRAPHPEINFTTPTDDDRTRLQAYLDSLAPAKKPTKSERRAGA